ncbi:unnamed protein product, partial [marine sediment metagenome]
MSIVHFVYGYRPSRIKRIEDLASEYSDPADIIRLGPVIHKRQIIEITRLLSSAPISMKSTGKSAVLYMDKAGRGIQTGLLKLLEDTPANSLFILTKDSIENILPTILSRCVLTKMSYPSYGDSVRDLAISGMTFKAAASLAI